MGKPAKYLAIAQGTTYTGIFDMSLYTHTQLTKGNSQIELKGFRDLDKAKKWYFARGGNPAKIHVKGMCLDNTNLGVSASSAPESQKNKGAFRAVARGKQLGIFNTNIPEEKEAFVKSIHKFKGLFCRKFETYAEAEKWLKDQYIAKTPQGTFAKVSPSSLKHVVPHKDQPMLIVAQDSLPDIVTPAPDLYEQGKEFSLFPLDAGRPAAHIEFSDNPFNVPQIETKVVVNRNAQADDLSNIRFELMQTLGMTDQIILSEANKDNFQLFTDASFNVKHPFMAGVGIVILSERKVIASLSLPLVGEWLVNNTVAEYAAITCGLLLFCQPASIYVLSDCQFGVKAVKDGIYPKGIEILKQVPELFSCHKLQVDYIRGHAGYIFNEECDILAKMALNQLDKKDINLHARLQAQLACYRPLEKAYLEIFSNKKKPCPSKEPPKHKKAQKEEKSNLEQISLF